ncbi:hypothetical protein MIND_00251200 [Mycena indigotica]|uniref:Uncharacterized protein n=1 Tax=Mycena indigotica TaxID=2126181 RepID=A0A8H6T7U3_9AGAR|nr:uncharacterized protein MIND_00251200 [Mycena indigotica]KAF7312379.1 hypothetical protein MIND_00251200 [Mycena indigotica]
MAQDSQSMSQMFPGDTLAQEHTSLALLAVYNFLQIFGFMIVLITLIIAWISPGVHRSRVWYSFMLSWLFFCLSYFMLAGSQVGPEPPASVCLVQAALIYAGPVLTSAGTLSVMLHMYLILWSVFKNKARPSKRQITMIQVYPYIVGLLTLIIALGIGLAHPSIAARDDTGFYCHYTSSIQPTITAVVVLLTVLVMISFEAKTALLLYRNWTAFRKFHSQDGISLALIVRLSIFSILPMVAGGLTALSFFTQSTVNGAKTHLATAILPSAAGFIFGTQNDILRGLMFWKPKAESDETEPKDSAVV